MAEPDPILRWPMSLDAFIDWDESQPERWELVDGAPRMMAGNTIGHAIIVGNLAAAFHARLRNSEYRTFASGTRLAINAADAFRPDLQITREQLDMTAPFTAAPSLICEVFSPGTRAYDREEKLTRYADIPGLAHVVLVDQDRVQVEVFSAADGFETPVVLTAGASLVLEQPAIAVPLAEIYEGLAV